MGIGEMAPRFVIGHQIAGVLILLIGLSCCVGAPAAAEAEVNNCITGEKPYDFGERFQNWPKVTHNLKLEVSCNPPEAFELSSVTPVEVSGLGDESVLSVSPLGTDTCIDRQFTTKGEECTTEVFFDPHNPAGSYLTILTFQYAGEEETWLTSLEGEIKEILFHGETYPVTVTGAQTGTDVFTTNAGNVSCSSVATSGSLSETSKVLELTPAFSGCTAFGFINVPIDVNGCKYQFTSGENVEGSFKGSVHIVCPKEKAIEITGPGCTVTVGSQTPTGGELTYTNLGSGATRELKIDTALTGIHYIEDKSGGFSTCVHTGETATNGTYTGHTLITGENASKVHKGIWVG